MVMSMMMMMMIDDYEVYEDDNDYDDVYIDDDDGDDDIGEQDDGDGDCGNYDDDDNDVIIIMIIIYFYLLQVGGTVGDIESMVSELMIEDVFSHEKDLFIS